jgi:LPPG:FO 2-phospho-L-lactate transferase
VKVALLAGGTGAALLARGLAALLPGGDLSVITNTGDDDEFCGLLVCPDTDSVLYRLAGIFNEDAGFGVRDETFHALEMLGRLGEETWFSLGDRDIGLHLRRATLRRQGASLSEATAEIARQLGIAAQVIPMSDDPVRTRIATDEGEVRLQEWFVREACRPPLRGLRYAGLETARSSPAALAAVEAADLVVIGPSNPLLSIDPILRLLAPHLHRNRVLAVSPVIGGRSLKGPTVSMMAQLGEEPSALGVARHYAEAAGTFVLDRLDAGLAAPIHELGMRALVLDAHMPDAEGEQRLAAAILSAAGRRAEAR